MKALVLAALLIAPGVRAESTTVDLGSEQYLDSDASTGLWNTDARRIQAGVAPDLDSNGDGDAAAALDFGDGSDGAFLDGPEGQGISVSGSTITIDTDVKDEFEFSSFTLSSGKTLRVEGGSPLVIRVRGATRIEGSIDATGGTGGANGLSGTPAGGTAGPGGGAGGAGAAVGAGAGTAGTAGGAEGDAGGAGASNATTVSYEGGGGGCFGDDGVFDSDDGVNGANRGTCGSTQAAIAGALETTFHGGSGGGGGGAYNGGGDEVTGSGAGGGGGAVRIVSMGAVSITGSLSAEGGEGGTADVSNDGGADTDCGGGGGGGSGGAVWVQSAGAVGGPGGAVSVAGGSGGTSDTCSGSAIEGGEGSRGVVRVDSSTGALSGITVSPNGADRQADVLALAGETFTVVSTGIEVFPGEGIWDLGEPTETAGCGSDGELSVTYQGSDDGVTFGEAVPGSRLSELSDRRYVRFRVRIDTTGGDAPCLRGLTFNYTPRVLSDLTLSGGLFFCGTVGRGGGGPLPPPRAWGDVAFLALVLTAGWRLGRRVRVLSIRP